MVLIKINFCIALMFCESLEYMLKDIYTSLIELSFIKLSALNGLDDILIGLMLLPHGKVASCFDSTDSVMGCSPVTYYHSVESPFFSEDVG